MIPQESPQKQTKQPRQRWRKFVFRLLSVLMGLSLFPLIEASCYLLDLGREDVDSDPFVGFADVRPLFEPVAGMRNSVSSEGTLFETSKTRRGFFAPQSFQVPKPKREFRIFVFGGSTVQGNPFQPATSFTTFLEQALKVASDEYDWKVINCGGISYASYRLLPIMQECTAYEPDLFIFCEGHNEFLEEITYADIKSSASRMSDIYGVLNQFRSFRILDRAIRTPSDVPSQPLTDARPVLPLEVDALLDHQGGLEKYHRDDDHRTAVVEHFRVNLERAVRLSDTASVPLLLMLPPTNLRDCPPFKSECSPGLSDESLRQLTDHLDLAAGYLANEPDKAVDCLQKAVEIDPRFAFAWYHLGHAYLAAHRIDDAKAAFTRARDEDVCPLRMTSDLEKVTYEVVAAQSCELIDLSQLLAQHSKDGIPGDDVLVDHIHPSFVGHQQIAIRIVEWMEQFSLVQPTSEDWIERSYAEFGRHLASLDSLYFLRGQRALRDLRGWAEGRARKPFVKRGETDPPSNE